MAIERQFGSKMTGLVYKAGERGDRGGSKIPGARTGLRGPKF